VADGEVVKVFKTRGGGNQVKIAHANGKTSMYAHLTKATVNEGDQVVAGQQIAISGATGKVTGPHLHFELWRKRRPLNPLRQRWQYVPGRVEPPPAPTPTPVSAQPESAWAATRPTAPGPQPEL
jgi:murein DD-endopeptidase MepM/ murein hydrolase activator NlpD